MASLKVKDQCYPNKFNSKKVGWWALGQGEGAEHGSVRGDENAL